MRPSLENSQRRIMLVVVLACIALLGTACSSKENASVTYSPPPSRDMADATRAELTGSDSSLLELHAIAEQLKNSEASGACDAEIPKVLSLATQRASEPLSDPILNELFADEEASLDKSLGNCAALTPNRAQYAELEAAREEVSTRLAVDGLRP